VTIREQIARFIENEGHRVETAMVADAPELGELVFRTRGQAYSVAVSELEPERYSLSTAYEVPESVREPQQTRDLLRDLVDDYPDARFDLTQDDTVFVVTIEYEGLAVDAFLASFWEAVGQLRDAGTGAIARMVDRSESKSAADKFIRQFLKRDR
jgi:hypothetical protein